jgi:hypothetical protein
VGDDFDPALGKAVSIHPIDIPKKQAGWQVECMTCRFRGSPGECRPLTNGPHGLLWGQEDLKIRIKDHLVETGVSEKEADRVIGLEEA